MQPTVGDEKLHISSLWLGKKNYVQYILYGRNVNLERMLQVLSFMYNIDNLQT